MIKRLSYILACVIALGGQQGMVYAKDNYSQNIIAVSPSPTSTPSKSPTSTPSKSPTSTPTPKNKNNPSNQDGINILIILLAVFLVFKGVEVFYNQRKMAYLWENINEAIQKLSSIPDDIKSLTKAVESLTETVEELKKQQTNTQTVIEKQLNDKSSKPIEAETLSQKLSDDIKQTVQESLSQQINGIITRVITALKDNPEFIDEITKAITKRLSQDIKSISETPEYGADSNLLLFNTGKTQSDNEDSSVPNEESSALTSEEKNVVDNYNKRVDLKQWITEVATTKDTELEGRTGRDFSAILNKDTEAMGMYWIITGTDGSYLVPNYNKKFNSHQMKSVQNLFECEGYRKEVTDANKFRLKKPARVSVVSSGETWILNNDGKGILDFSG